MLNLSHPLPHRPHVAPAWYLVPLATVIATVVMILAVGAGTEPSDPATQHVDAATLLVAP